MRLTRRSQLDANQKKVLGQRLQARPLAARVVGPPRIVLLATAGKQCKAITLTLNITPHKAARWRNRFPNTGLAGLAKDALRFGRSQSFGRQSSGADP